MFWRFGGYASVSTIDTLLDKPDVSLEDLLDETELIQELKQHNSKLIEYLREDHVLKRLLDYVIAPSPVSEDRGDEEGTTAEGEKTTTSVDSGDGAKDPLKTILDPDELEKIEKNRLKHAYVACEILSSEIWSILESVMLNTAYLRDFWGFLRRPAPLDSAQASYFTKVNETLFDKKTEDMLEFFKSLEGIIPAMLQHVDNPMVMDLLLKIISLEKAEGGQGTVDVSFFFFFQSCKENCHGDESWKMYRVISNVVNSGSSRKISFPCCSHSCRPSPRHLCRRPQGISSKPS